MALVKICGLNDPAGVDSALAGGARYLGFVFFAKSPRHIAPEAAAPLMARAKGRADTVAVTVNATDAELAALAAQARPDWIQAHGQESPARLADIKRYADKGVIRAFGVAHAADLDAVSTYAGSADMFLFDAKPPAGADRPGGNAAAFDWTILAGRSLARPWFLSGGLTPENIGEAIRLSGAALVDVSSGVEHAPGLKNPARIAAFLAAAQAGPLL